MSQEATNLSDASGFGVDVDWVIAEGEPTVRITIHLDNEKIARMSASGKESAVIYLPVAAAHTLGAVLKEKSEAAKRKADVVLEHKLGHEDS